MDQLQQHLILTRLLRRYLRWNKIADFVVIGNGTLAVMFVGGWFLFDIPVQWTGVYLQISLIPVQLFAYYRAHVAFKQLRELDDG